MHSRTRIFPQLFFQEIVLFRKEKNIKLHDIFLYINKEVIPLIKPSHRYIMKYQMKHVANQIYQIV